MKKMSKVEQSKTDKEWEAENDARTLMEAEVIKGDPKRLEAATKAADKLSKEKVDEAASMQKVAGFQFYKNMDSENKE
jgi:hypothetical protein